MGKSVWKNELIAYKKLVIMTYTNPITNAVTEATYVRSNEAHDIYFVRHNGDSDYKYYPRNSGINEEDVINELLS